MLALGIVVLLYPALLFGQDGGGNTDPIISIVNAIIAVLTPIAVSGLKKLWKSLNDKQKKLIPFIAPLVGAAASILAHVAGLTPGSTNTVIVISGLLAGAVGLWLREAIKQTTPLKL